MKEYYRKIHDDLVRSEWKRKEQYVNSKVRDILVVPVPPSAKAGSLGRDRGYFYKYFALYRSPKNGNIIVVGLDTFMDYYVKGRLKEVILLAAFGREIP